MKLPKIYDAKEYEDKIYALWEESGAFQPSDAKDTFSITMPPPNATGRLHVGHAAMLAVEDVLVRYNRMQGKSVLWTPGTDHAGIATNAIIEKRLADEGRKKEDIGREEFLKQLSKFVDESIDTIRTQIKAMGSSTDWTRERYTMEPAMNRIVSEVFINMYKDGLIYRGHRIVNWDHVLQTVVSDDELNYKDEQTTLYTFKYGPFEISTARPETKFGDKYVVMHPDDKRYAKYKHGDTFEAEWINGKVTATIVKDEVIDPEFGTGVMTITPWHDVTDFEIAKRHDLDFEQIIDNDGKLLKIADEFAGMHIDDAREKIVKKLDDKGLLVASDDSYTHRIAISDRGNAVIEPQIMEQWFIDVNKPAVKWHGKKMTLKQVMQAVVKDGEITILPERFNKTYFNWIDNLRDWNISRQIWWGHQIPAWYKEDGDNTEVHVGHVPPDDSDWQQDPDTLDTWFSSALWTWSTLIPPDVALNEKYSIHDMLKHSDDYKKFHPTTVMETGYDIIFFWVARMILMTTYNIGEIPFETVYLHGLVRAKDGSKMSKSRPEDIIDPLDVIPKYGTDSLRLSLLVGQAPGNDMRIFEEKIASYRNFNNKLWNIARFVEDRVSDVSLKKPEPKSDADFWILYRLGETTDKVAELLDGFELGKAFDELYHFLWNDYADWYVEASKIHLNQSVLVHVLETSLKLAHPFVPFVTETIWGTLDWEEGLLISAQWPTVEKVKPSSAENFAEIKKIVSEVRHLRATLATSENTLYFSEAGFIQDNADLIAALARLVGVKQVESGKGLHLTKTKHKAWIDVEEAKVHEYLAKLKDERKSAESQVANLKKRLENKNYVKHAPKAVVTQTHEQLQENEQHLAKLTDEVEAFKYAMDEGQD